MATDMQDRAGVCDVSSNRARNTGPRAPKRNPRRWESYRLGSGERTYLLWAFVLIVNACGGVMVWLFLLHRPLLGMSVGSASDARAPFSFEEFQTAVVLAAIATSLAAAPFIGFLSNAWYARFDEFRNSLKDGALLCYLRRFWSARLLDACFDMGCVPTRITDDFARTKRNWKSLEEGDSDVPRSVFETIYHEQFGLGPFLPPFLLLIVVTYAEASVMAWLRGCTGGDAACSASLFGATPMLVVSAIAGAYMFAVSDAVVNIRRRSLNVSDVYWYAIRALLALPIATLFAATSSGSYTPALAFATAMLPVDVLVKQIRRLAFISLGQTRTDEEGDQLLLLAGMTSPVVSLFLAEGVYSIEQVAASDPVLLSIRTGLPFRFVLRLGAQAVVRRHLGDGAKVLMPIGLADAGPICEIVKREKSGDFKVATEAAAARLAVVGGDSITAAVVAMKFHHIAGEEYSKMIAKIAPLREQGEGAAERFLASLNVRTSRSQVPDDQSSLRDASPEGINEPSEGGSYVVGHA